MQDCLCPVCYAPVDATHPQGCPACQTPHHEECFRFAGACGIFGCGGQQFAAFEPAPSSGAMSIDDTPTLAAPLIDEGPRSFRFNRAIWWRLADAWRCQLLNARTTLAISFACALVPVLAALLLGITPIEVNQSLGQRLPEAFQQLGYGPRLFLGLFLGVLSTTGILAGISGAALQILLTSRAQGKDRTPGELAGMVARRLFRIAGACFRSVLWMFGPVVVFFTWAWGLGTLTGPVMMVLLTVAAFAGSAAWVFWQSGLLSLSWIVAAMGEEESGDALERSRQLVRVDFWHVVMGIHGALALTMIGITILMVSFRFLPQQGPLWARFLVEWAALALLNFVAYSLTYYYTLQYLECRRAVDQDAFRFAGALYTGGSRQVSSRQAPHNVVSTFFTGAAGVAYMVTLGVLIAMDPQVHAQVAARVGKDAAVIEALEAEVARGNPDALNQTAWILATSSSAELLDGPRALDLAGRAVRARPGSAAFRDTLAAAYARQGKYPSAVVEQQLAVRMLEEQSKLIGYQGLRSQLPGFQSRADVYRANQPYVDTRFEDQVKAAK